MTEYKVKVFEDRTKWYNLEGQLHRENGPAIEWDDGSKAWFINGKRHRVDGPAIEKVNGYKVWYINGQELTKEEFNKRIKSCANKIVEIDGKKYKLTEI